MRRGAVVSRTLVEHARTELDLLGADPGMAATLVAAVAAFVSYPSSGVRRRRMIRLLVMLLQGRTLSPLTVSPDEWVDRSERAGVVVWQNVRDPRAVSEDQGRTFRRRGWDGRERAGVSVVPPVWVRELRDRDGLSEDQARAAIGEYLDSGPITPSDVGILDTFRGAADRFSYMMDRWGPRGFLAAELLYQDRGRLLRG